MTERVHFVLPQMTPYYGMEKAAALLMAALVERHWDVTATVLSGGIPRVAAGLRLDALEIPRSPVRLVRAVPPLRRGLAHLPDDALIVACGLWAAAPVATALVATGRSYIAWEHSVLAPRLQIDKRVAVLLRLVDTPGLRPARVVAVSEGVRRAVASRWPGVPASVVTTFSRTNASAARAWTGWPARLRRPSDRRGRQAAGRSSAGPSRASRCTWRRPRDRRPGAAAAPLGRWFVRARGV